MRLHVVWQPWNEADSSTGHQGMHGHEFLEFEYGQGELLAYDGADRAGRLRYANNSNYRNDSLIRKEGALAGRCRGQADKQSMLAQQSPRS